MKATLWTLVILSSTFLPAARQGKQEKEGQEKKKSASAITRFFQDETERLTKEIDGSWMLTEYTDPEQLDVAEGLNGFAMFHDGYLTLMTALDGVTRRLFRYRSHIYLQAGTYRYRIDEQTNLQLSSVMLFSNDTDDGELEHHPAGQVFEFLAKLEEGVLELRDTTGLLMTSRKVSAGEFPESAIRKLDSHRSGTPFWEKDDEPPR